MKPRSYVLATRHAWNFRAFETHRESLPGNWHMFASPKDLSAEQLLTLQPRYVFFPHWSWIVPSAIYDNHECILFHMTDLPFGRGGSPLQNLVASGIKETKVCAVRMTKELDAGPIYLRERLPLAGTAQQIFENLAELTMQMIGEICRSEPDPIPQSGEPTAFRRRTADMSEIPQSGSIEYMYDHIRMLDADGYPRAYADIGEWRIEFSDAELLEGVGLRARADLKKREK